MKADISVFPNLGDGWEYDGLEVRDYIAIKAMSRLIGGYSRGEVIKLAYLYADEMIEESNK